MLKRFSGAILALVLVLALALPIAAADLGPLNQADITVKVYEALAEVNAKSLEGEGELTLYAVGEEAYAHLDPELFTGYSVKDGSEAAGYDSGLTVRYGHAAPGHLLELVSVMKHRGLNPNVSVESRISSYIHYMEWGEPGPDTLYTPLDDTRGIIYVREYDAVFAFEDEEALREFDTFAQAYALKRSGEEDRPDLIGGSWYVPLYTVESAQPGYQKVSEIRVVYDDHYLVNYALDENADTIRQGLESLVDEAYQVEVGDVWVNDGFYLYLGGQLTQ